MSDENPAGEPPEYPPPSGAPPGGPPGSYPSYPADGYDGPPPQGGRSGGNGRILLGIALAIPVLVVSSALAGGLAALDDTGVLSGIVGFCAFVGPLVMLVFDRTRKVAIGILIGYAVIFVVLAGLCVALIAAYD